MINKYTTSELEKLISLDGECVIYNDIKTFFNNRSVDNVSKKAKKLGLNIKFKYNRSNLYTIEDLNLLSKNYQKDKKDLQKMFPNRSWCSIVQKINKMGLIRRNVKWSNKEIIILNDNYENMSIENILHKLPNRSWDSIVLQSNKLGLSRSNEFNRKAKMEKLLDGSFSSFYWMGFLLADGHFDNTNKRIKLSISEKDEDLMIKFCNFLEIENYRKSYTIINGRKYFYVNATLQNIDVFDLISELYSLVDNKTEYPPSFSKFALSDEEMMCVIIGFIDGDGCIKKVKRRMDYSITIHVHSSWLENIIYMENIIYKYLNIGKTKQLTKIGNDGYTSFTISRGLVITRLKEFSLSHNLPHLKRKWDIIDINYKSKYDIFSENRVKIKDLLDSNKSISEICDLVGCKMGIVYKIKRELRDK